LIPHQATSRERQEKKCSWGLLCGFDFNRIGHGIVALFVFTWAGAAILWKTTRFEERWAKVLTADAEPLRR
jgi:high-affinity nickel permease